VTALKSDIQKLKRTKRSRQSSERVPSEKKSKSETRRVPSEGRRAPSSDLAAELREERKRREDFEFLISLKDKEIGGLMAQIDRMTDELQLKD
jgi:hypothetical protein